MFSLGSKAFFAITAFTLVCAIVYGNITTDRVGVVVLLGAVAVSALLGVAALAATGSADRFAITGTDEDRSRPATASGAPFVAALGLGALVIGAITGIEGVVIGLLLLAVSGVVWFIGSWREHPAYARALTPRITDRLTLPVGLPVVALGLILLSAFSVSRTMLAASKNGATVVALVLALVIFVIGFVLAARPALSPRFVNAVVALGVLATAAMLVVGLVKGERSFEHHGGSHSAEAGHSKEKAEPAAAVENATEADAAGTEGDGTVTTMGSPDDMSTVTEPTVAAETSPTVAPTTTAASSVPVPMGY